MGSEKYPFKGILDLLANRGFSNGTNAWTDTDHTAYTISTAGEQGFLQLLPIYVDHILYPTITKAGCVCSYEFLWNCLLTMLISFITEVSRSQQEFLRSLINRWLVGASYRWKRTRFWCGLQWNARKRKYIRRSHGASVRLHFIYSQCQTSELSFRSLQRLLDPVGSGYRSETGGLMDALRVLTPQQSGLVYFIF